MSRSRQAESTHTVTIGGLTVQLTRKPIKSLRVTVHPPEGEVRVSAPHAVPLSVIHAFVESRADWIKRHQALVRDESPASLDYVTGEQIPFAGRMYPLDVVHRPGRPSVTLHDDARVVLSVPASADRSQRERAVDAWYRAHLDIVVPPLIAAWEARLGVSITEWRVRKMKTRWGTCSIKARRIWLNIALAAKPPECLEYLIVHELIHLLEPSHNARFKALMDQHLPNWRALRVKLNRGNHRQDD
ncbi:MAG: M48 family metallopeptidase [Chloroflexi bacterium]|nr:M48 family metallopeptidase [Anaerolineae bacterium]MCC6567443.1 M48 family metallopeptidase [Chloroflexota bacterium]MEB2365626.1 SprT family zinc-dependent metalloprotease [Chloroflexota bacterium]